MGGKLTAGPVPGTGAQRNIFAAFEALRAVPHNDRWGAEHAARVLGEIVRLSLGGKSKPETYHPLDEIMPPPT